MIRLMKNGLINPDELDTMESKIFREFLKIEKVRHQKDIDKIDKTIKNMRW